MKSIQTVLFLLIMILMNTGYAAKQRLTISFNEEPNPPYVIGPLEHMHSKRPGITIEVLQLIGKSLNLDIVFKPLPDKRSFLEVANGGTDGSFHWSYNTKRAKVIEYPMNDGDIDSSKKLMTQTYALYKLKNSNLKWDGIRFHFLDNHPILGANLGFSIIEILEEKGAKIHQLLSTKGLMKMLLLGRLDGIVTIDTYGDYAIKTLKTKDILKVSPTIKQKDYFLVFSQQFVKKSPALASDIWNEINKINTTGMYKIIARKYSE